MDPSSVMLSSMMQSVSLWTTTPEKTITSPSFMVEAVRKTAESCSISVLAGKRASENALFVVPMVTFGANVMYKTPFPSEFEESSFTLPTQLAILLSASIWHIACFRL